MSELDIAIKAKDLAWWQNQFKSKSGVETKDIADSFLELIEYAENIVGALDAIMLFGTDIDKAKEFAKMALETKKPKCME